MALCWEMIRYLLFIITLILWHVNCSYVCMPRQHGNRLAIHEKPEGICWQTIFSYPYTLNDQVLICKDGRKINYHYDCTFGCTGHCWKANKEKSFALNNQKHVVCIDRMDNTHKIGNYSVALKNHYFLYCWPADVN